MPGMHNPVVPCSTDPLLLPTHMLRTCCGPWHHVYDRICISYPYTYKHIADVYVYVTHVHTHIYIYISTWNQIISIYPSTSYTSLYIYTDMYSHGSHHDLSRNAPSRHSLRPLRHYWWWLARQAPFSHFSQGKRWKRHGKTAHLSGSIIICR